MKLQGAINLIQCAKELTHTWREMQMKPTTSDRVDQSNHSTFVLGAQVMFRPAEKSALVQGGEWRAFVAFDKNRSRFV